jgi:hypothetical protein
MDKIDSQRGVDTYRVVRWVLFTAGEIVVVSHGGGITDAQVNDLQADQA